jgi:hypothetical protein
MTDVTDDEIEYTCGWLRSFIRYTENSLLDLNIRYIADLTVENVENMVLRDVLRRHPTHEYLIQHVRNWPLTLELRRVIGAISTHGTPNQEVTNRMEQEIIRTQPRTGPPGPQEFHIVYPPPGAQSLNISSLLYLLQNTHNNDIRVIQ